MGDLDGIYDELRSMALIAGCPEHLLDGKLRCHGGCGKEVARSGTRCGECESAFWAKERADAFRRSWATVPQALHWISLDSDGLLDWVGKSNRAAIEKTREVAADLKSVRNVVFVGPQKSGKTSLACALLREFLRAGSRVDSNAYEKRTARRAMFCAADNILLDIKHTRLGEHVVSLDVARNAGVIVLDEVGRGKDHTGDLTEMFFERHRRSRPTIVTTPLLSASQFASVTGDGGLARRVFDDACVIEVRL